MAYYEINENKQIFYFYKDNLIIISFVGLKYFIRFNLAIQTFLSYCASST